MIKKIFFIIFSVFLVFQTIQLLDGITEQSELNKMGPAIFISFLLALYITGVFAFAGLLAVLIALATVSYQSIKAAVSNPVDALRYE